MKLESVLDIPQLDLDDKVWVKNPQVDGGYELTQEARSKIDNIVNWILSNKILSNFGVRITGSITSNQFSENSDVDVHFNSPEIPNEKADEFNKSFRLSFEQFKQSVGEDYFKIGTHTIEIYFQINPFQDLMSIGCYDYIHSEWLVGPELLPLDYDPYSEYFNDDMRYINSIISDIRNVILECYEIVVALNNSQDQEFKSFEYSHLIDKLSKAANIFTSAREFRKTYSTPKSEQDALTMRTSREWKIADSAFKLMDKFGYLGILRELTKCWEEFNQKTLSPEDAINRIIDVILNNIMKNPSLQNVDKELFENIQNESFKGSIYATIAALLMIPGVVNANTLTKKLSEIPTDECRISNNKVAQAVADSATTHKTYGGLYITNAINLIARCLYLEARGKTEGPEGRKAVMSVIGNRSDWNPDNVVAVLQEHLQFSSLNKYDGWTNDTFVYFSPVEDKDIFDECVELAVEFIDGKFKSTIGNRNSYLNKAVCKIHNPSVVGPDGWGTLMKNLIKIGKHTFGYLREHDPNYVIPGTMNPKPRAKVSHQEIKPLGKIHVIKVGDKLDKIAKKYGVTRQHILKLNPKIKDADTIRIGMKLSI